MVNKWPFSFLVNHSFKYAIVINNLVRGVVLEELSPAQSMLEWLVWSTAFPHKSNVLRPCSINSLVFLFQHNAHISVVFFIMTKPFGSTVSICLFAIFRELCIRYLAVVQKLKILSVCKSPFRHLVWDVYLFIPRAADLSPALTPGLTMHAV